MRLRRGFWRCICRALPFAIVALVCVGAGPTARAAAASLPPADFYGANVQPVFESDPLIVPQSSWSDAFATMASDGLMTARMDAMWKWVEPNAPVAGQHTYDWTVPGQPQESLDTIVGTLAQAGIRMEAVLDEAPAWTAGANSYLTPAYYGDYEAYAAAFAARYGAGGSFWLANPQLPYLPVQQFEIWDEANSDNFWTTVNAATYEPVLVATSAAIHAVDPSAEVLPSIAYLNAASYVAQLYALGMQGSVQGIAFHPYGGDALTNVSLVEQVRAAMVAGGDANLPIYATEIGLPASTPTYSSYVTDAERAGTLSMTGDALAHGDCGVDSYLIYALTGSGNTTDGLGDGSYYGMLDPTTFQPNATGAAIIAAEQRWESSPAGGLVLCGSGATPTQDLLPIGLHLTHTSPACVSAQVTYEGNPLPSAELVLLATNNRVDGIEVNAAGQTQECVDNNGPEISTFTAYAELSAPATTASLTSPNMATSIAYICDTNPADPCKPTASLPTPVITVPANVTAAATSSAGATVSYTVTYSDADSTIASSGCTPASGSTFPIGATTVTCSATDAVGLSASKTFTVTVNDTTPPTISVPGGVSDPASGPSGATVSYTATFADAYSTLSSTGCTPASGSVFAIGATTVTCTATDAAGLTTTKTFSVTVTDLTPPTITGVPSAVTATATSSAGATVSYTSPTASDIVYGAVSVNCSPASGSTFPIGTTTVSCSATDGAANTAAATFTVSVVDTTPPVILAPADITAAATGPLGADVSYSASYSDAYSTITASGCTPPSGSAFPIGTTTVTCSATDKAGNTTSKTFTVTVTDLTPPTISGVPSNLKLQATSSSGAIATYTTPSAGDIVYGSVPVSCTPQSGSTFAIGTTTVSCSATDGAANTATATFTVTVTPVLTITTPANITTAATSSAGATVNYTTTFSDSESTISSSGCSPSSGATFPIGTTTVNCSASDAIGDNTTATFTVTITPIVTITVPSKITVAATGATGASVDYTVTFSDSESTISSSGCSPSSGATFPIGTTTVQCSATDNDGNTSTNSFEVTVTDLTPPKLTGVPGNITTAQTSSAGALVLYTAPSANDIVDGAVPVNCTPGSGSTFAPGTTTVSCSATDTAANTATASFTVTVEDTTPPAITTPGSITTAATGGTGALVNYTTTFTDAYSTLSSQGCEPGSGSTFPIGTTTVSCSASDAAGNTTSTAFDVTVTDLTPPTLSGVPADLTLAATSSVGASATFATPTASDIVDGAVPVKCTPASGSIFAIGTTTVSCSATDKAGNKATQTFTVTVTNSAAPAITGVPADITTAQTSSAGAVVSYATPTATDVVDGSVPVSCAPASGTTFAAGVTTVTCSATDRAGNSASKAFTVTVRDTTPPSITVPPGIATPATSSAGAVVSYTTVFADPYSTISSSQCTPASGSTFPIGTTTVTCSATDAAGNTTATAFAVTVTATATPSGQGTPGAASAAAPAASRAYSLSAAIVKIRARTITLRARLTASTGVPNAARLRVWIERANGSGRRLIGSVTLADGRWLTFTSRVQARVGDRIVIDVEANAAVGLTALQAELQATRRDGAARAR
ncbi:MAG: HYR domain-containing protein [Solirubrobacteraceae bacterium]